MPELSNSNRSVFCSVDQYFNCIVKKKELLKSQNKNCQCVEPCVRSSYQPSLSYSAISSLSVENLLSINTASVKKHFYTAKNLKQRIYGSTLVNDLSTMEKFLRNFDSLQTFSRINTLSYSQSIFFKLRKCIDEITEIYASDMKTLYPFLQTFSTTFEKTYGSSRLALRNYFQSTRIQMSNIFYSAFENPSADPVNQSEILYSLKLHTGLLQLTKKYKDYAIYSFPTTNLNADTKNSLPLKLYIASETNNCTKTGNIFIIKLKKIIQSLKILKATEIGFDFHSDYQTYIDKGMQFMSCIDQYYNVLHTAEEWQEETENFIVTLSADKGKFAALENFDFEVEWLKISKLGENINNFLIQYSKHETNKYKNRENLDPVIIEEAITNINKFVNKIQVRLIDAMRSMITSSSTSLKKGYVDALDKLEKIYKYQGPAGQELLSAAVQNFSIWRRQQANVEEPSNPIRYKVPLQVLPIFKLLTCTTILPRAIFYCRSLKI